MEENKKPYVFLRFACCEEEDSKFICMHSFFWCRKINLNGDKKTANERVEFHKAKQCKKVCFDFKLLTLAGRGGQPRIFAQTNCPCERESEQWSQQNPLLK